MNFLNIWIVSTAHSGFLNISSIVYSYTFRILIIKVLRCSSPLFHSTLTNFLSHSYFHFSVFSPYLFSHLHSSLFLRSLSLSFNMSSPPKSTLAAFHRSVIGGSYGMPAQKSGLKRNVAVSLLISVDGIATSLITATLGGCLTM